MGTLNIKDPEVRALAKELARRRGETMTEAVKHALREQLGSERGAGSETRRVVARVLERARRTAALPVLDPRTAEEILGYEEHGVPR